ncbi:sugar ABC transporter permease [Pacificibacter sp. AS14]|uniref:carbohydrate ABC transporter permease n=1 Tax=Pacificibacter sp. AS14 TaxID=3135785 RepID=UPI003170472C
MQNRRRIVITALVFLLPTIVGTLIFRLIPIIWSFALSFYEWKVFDKAVFVGWKNYAHIFTSSISLDVFVNSAIFSVIYVAGSLALALVLAVVLNNGLRSSAFFRGAFFVPYITATVAIALAWRWIFSTRFGVLNNLLIALGVENPPAWLADPAWALPAVALVSIWKDVGFYMILLLAGLQTIDPTLYQAARVDGAGPIARFRKVTVPLLTRSLFFVLIIALVRSTQTFEITYALTNGGPNRASTTLAFFVYQKAFVDFEVGYAAALSYIMCVILGFLTLVSFYFRRKWVHE